MVANNAKKPARQRMTTEEVVAEVLRKCPSLVEHMFLDREWVWYCGPSLKNNAEVRTALSEIGFRFSPKGHLMPDGETIGSWGHSCLRPIFARRQNKKQSASNRLEQPTEPDWSKLGL